MVGREYSHSTSIFCLSTMYQAQRVYRSWSVLLRSLQTKRIEPETNITSLHLLDFHIYAEKKIRQNWKTTDQNTIKDRAV